MDLEAGVDEGDEGDEGESPETEDDGLFLHGGW
jgi:hypothetical protein